MCNEDVKYLGIIYHCRIRMSSVVYIYKVSECTQPKALFSWNICLQGNIWIQFCGHLSQVFIPQFISLIYIWTKAQCLFSNVGMPYLICIGVEFIVENLQFNHFLHSLLSSLSSFTYIFNSLLKFSFHLLHHIPSSKGV